ncbi:MAG: DEAD/DEAH box helicase family protein, partial [Candidatus Methanomethylophilaceae archaeon]|nr:DEAD/DEAH box helicase family protein [Candidatus Methanomethylophilaceae archaeon]
MPAHFCPRCKSLVRPGLDRCQFCGTYITEDNQTNQMGLFESLTKVPEPKVIAKENADAPYLPYEPRPSQLQIIRDIRDALDSGKHIVIESGTGTGKTIVSLAAALEHAVPRGRKIVYLTRTITQSDQVMKEVRAISSLKKITGVPVTGRSRSCPMIKTLKGYDTLSPTILSSICEQKKSSHRCRYFESLKDKLPAAEEFLRTKFPKSDELDQFCEKMGTCPYEMKKLLMKGCDVVAAPYVHILSEDIRTNFLRNMDVEDSQIVLVIDEAHNLIDAARDQESFTIDCDMLDAAIDECSTMRKEFNIAEGLTLKAFFEFLKRSIKSLATELIPFGKTEALLKPVTLLEDRIFSAFNISRSELSIILDKIEDVGD